MSRRDANHVWVEKVGEEKAEARRSGAEEDVPDGGGESVMVGGSMTIGRRSYEVVLAVTCPQYVQLRLRMEEKCPPEKSVGQVRRSRHGVRLSSLFFVLHSTYYWQPCIP